MARSSGCTPCGCFLIILASVAAAGFVACVTCGIGYGVSVSESCDTEAEASVESTFFAPKLQWTDGFLADGRGLCILEVTFSFEGVHHNRTLYAVCTSYRDFYRHSDSQTIAICFKGSPEGRDVLFAHGQFGTDVTSRRTTLRWRTALAVSGGVAAGGLVFMLMICWLQSCIGACKRKIGTTSVVVPIAKEQEIFTKV